MTDNSKRKINKTIVSLGGIFAISGFVIAYLEYKYFNSATFFGFTAFLIGWVLVVIGVIIDRLPDNES